MSKFGIGHDASDYSGSHCPMNPDQQLLRDMFISLRGMNLLGACGSLILVVLFRDQVDNATLAGTWLLAMWVLVLTQEHNIRQVTTGRVPSARRMRVFRVQVLLAGLLWGIAPFILSTQGLWQSTTLGIFLAAVALFPAYALAPIAGTYALTVLLCLVPFVVTSFMAHDETSRTELVAMMIAAITGFVIRISYAQRKRSLASVLSDVRARQTEVELAAQSRQLQIVRGRLASAQWQDGLTGVSTLAALCERLRESQPMTPHFHLAAINVVGFASINLAYGWEAGNFTLALIARRLTAFIGEPQWVARVGGDEFVMRLPASDRDIKQLTGELRTVLEKPVQWGGTVIPITVAIGVASSPGDATDPVQLSGNALIAVRQAQSGGPTREAVHYDRGTAEFARLASSLRWEIMRGLERNEFIVHYQPQVDLASGTFTGAEALVRWRHPERGLLRPDEFIAISEECGLIVPLGASVLRQTLRDVAAMDLPPHCKIAVNASLSEFSQSNLANRIKSALDEFGVAAGTLQIELTESILMSDPKSVIHTLDALHALGVSVALDDFGTGYSSLSYLHDLPIDNLKLDRIFVQNIPHDKRRMAIASAILHLASDLGIPVTCEGVERQEQWTWLLQHGCTYGQGYLIGRPMPVESLRACRERQLARPRQTVLQQV